MIHKSCFLMVLVAGMVLLSASLGVQAQACDGTVIPIDFTNVWGGERQPLMDGIIATFEAQNPCIQIVNDVMPFDGYAEQIATRLLSSDPPQVIMSGRVQTYQYASEGQLQSLSPYLEADGIDVHEVFYDSEINNQILDGQVWALPMPTAGGNTSFFFYNKDLVAQAGLDPEVGPQTWDDMITLAKGVNKLDARGIEVIATYPFGPDINSAFASWLTSNGGQYLSDDGRQVLFNSDRGLETLQWLDRLHQRVLWWLREHDRLLPRHRRQQRRLPLLSGHDGALVRQHVAVQHHQDVGPGNVQRHRPLGRGAAPLQLGKS